MTTAVGEIRKGGGVAIVLSKNNNKKSSQLELEASSLGKGASIRGHRIQAVTLE